jgi:hypothetical protein
MLTIITLSLFLQMESTYAAKTEKLTTRVHQSELGTPLTSGTYYNKQERIQVYLNKSDPQGTPMKKLIPVGNHGEQK